MPLLISRKLKKNGVVCFDVFTKGIVFLFCFVLSTPNTHLPAALGVDGYLGLLVLKHVETQTHVVSTFRKTTPF